jgi:hypothetical protein
LYSGIRIQLGKSGEAATEQDVKLATPRRIARTRKVRAVEERDGNAFGHLE